MSVRPAPVFAPLTPRALVLAVLAMGAVVLLSNVLVQYPINDWLTWAPSAIRSRSWSAT